MSNELMNLVYSGNGDSRAVRVVMRDGEPWFVVTDVCAILGIGNSRDVSARLEPEEKGLDSIDTPGGKQQVAITSEPGLYSVILGARANDRTRGFKRWVTREVLPSIRKTGSYTAPSITPALPDDPLTLALHAALETRREVADLTLRTDALEQQLADEPLRSTEINQIHKLGQSLGKAMGNYAQAWRLFKDRYGLASYRDLPKRDFEGAMKFLRHQIASYTGQDVTA
jgi:prophage antirepressor-like protein